MALKFDLNKKRISLNLKNNEFIHHSIFLIEHCNRGLTTPGTVLA